MDRIRRFFLRSKLTVPTLRPPLAPRPSLLARLNKGVKRALTLVSAPAGFGKSTALAQWIAQTTLSVAWVALDADDNDPVRFFYYLTLALADCDGELGDESASWPNVENLPARTLAASFLRRVEQRSTPLVLVLDDYQAIEAAPIHDALAFLLEHRPPLLHLIISSRADPPLPLARLRARRELLEIRVEELRFTVKEVKRFLKQGMGLDLSAADATRLAERTEGWIAGLQLAALSLRGHDDPAAFIADFSGSHRFILDYLVEEVVNRQPPPVAQFLLWTSVLERLNGSLCEAVTEQAGGQATLQQIEAANLFLIPLDEERRWYRYHHLFAELLRARLQQTESEAKIAALHRRAAAWYEANGWLVEAIQHTMAAGDMEGAANLIERHGHDEWGLSNASFLRLLGRLPPGMLQQRPLLGMYHAWTLIIYGQIPAAHALLGALAARLDEIEEDPEMVGVRAFIDLLLAYTPAMLGEAGPQQLPDPAALAQVPDSRVAMRNSADVVYAYLLYLRGDLETAASHLLVPVQRDVAVEGTTAVPIAISRLAQIRQVQGRLEEAKSLCRRYAAYVAERGGERFYVAGNLDLALGDLLREQNELDAAHDHIMAGLQRNEPWRIPHAQALGGLIQARLQAARGEPESALQTIRSLAETTGDRVILPTLLDEIEAFKVRLWLRTGDRAAADAWAAALLPLPPLSFRREMGFISLARVWLAAGRFDEAAALLERLAKAAAAGGRRGRLLQIDLLRAVVMPKLGEKSAAREMALDCVRRAAPEGYVRLFVDEGRPVQELLAAALRRPGPIPADYGRRLLDAFPQAIDDALAPQPSPMVDPLTAREREVLHLICRGLSNRAIAQQLTITISTVKKHAGNVYGKLGVSSRAQAMVRARELQLVPPLDASS